MNMVKEKQVKEQEPEQPVIMYTQEEVNFREDLMQKLMTLDHIKSVLVGRGDSEIFIKHTDELRDMVKNQFLYYMQQKQGATNAKQQPEKEPAGDDSEDGEAAQ